MKSRRISRALLWPAGFLLASLLMIGLSRPFVESIMPWIWEPAVETFVPEAGHVHRYRQEGWADTHFGRYGLPAVADLGAVAGPAALIWGDSQIEAFQVDDADKVAQQVTALTGGRTTGVGIGRGGRQIGDYLRLMPGYEHLCEPALHVVVIPNLRDAYPEERLEAGRRVYSLEAHPTVIGQRKLRRVFARLGLDYAFACLRSFHRDGGLAALRFRPGPVRAIRTDDLPLPPLEPAAAAATAAALRAATDRPLLLIYAPTLPSLEPPGLRTTPRPEDAAAAAVLAAACRDAGIAFVDLSDRLLDTWRATGRFPRGFPNGVPSRGHWNALGHRIAAEAIVEHLADLERED
jgi:hypothetical protein